MKSARGSLFYKIVNLSRLWMAGIRAPLSTRFFGPLILRLDGKASNISIGENVSFMPYVDLKVRENGRIVIGDCCRLDTCVRIVAAQEATVHMRKGVEIGMATIINGGADIDLGERVAIAAYCCLASSEHRHGDGQPILNGEYIREPIVMGANCWLANSVTVRPGTYLGDHCVVGAFSLVKGTFPDSSVLFGSPATAKRL